MFYEGEFMKAIRDEHPRIFLMSGGGNDILGSQFNGFLQDTFEDAPAGENPGRFLKHNFSRELESLGNLYDRVFYKLKGQPIDVIVHGYDYVIPWDKPNKGWLGRYMIEKGISSQEDRIAIIRYMIDHFNEQLSKTASRFDNVHYIDLRNTVRDDQWYDEIHPTSEGFQDIAVKFHKLIDEILSQ